jgi:hypothetical protein
VKNCFQSLLLQIQLLPLHRGTPRFTMSEIDLVLEFIQKKVTDLAFAVEVGLAPFTSPCSQHTD